MAKAGAKAKNLYTYNGKVCTSYQIAKAENVDINKLNYRLRKGCTVEEALSILKQSEPETPEKKEDTQEPENDLSLPDRYSKHRKFKDDQTLAPDRKPWWIERNVDERAVTPAPKPEPPSDIYITTRAWMNSETIDNLAIETNNRIKQMNTTLQQIREYFTGGDMR